MRIYMTIYPNILLFIGWLITIRLHKVHMSDVIYEVFENQTNWQQAANTCLRLNGTLIDSSDYCDVQNRNTLPANRFYWTGNFTFMTNWVQLKGCFNVLGQNTAEKLFLSDEFDKSERPLGWSCYIYCNNESFFGIRDGYCQCLSKVPAEDELTLQNKCPSCNDSSRFQCGKDNYTAVYAIPQPNSREGTNLCASVECIVSSNKSQHVARPCNEALRTKCTGGNQTKYLSWGDARNECEGNGTYMLLPPDIMCQSQVSQTWGNRHREVTWTTTELELLYRIQIHQKHRLLRCSSINGNTMKNDDCNSTEHGFICKIGNFTNENATTLCNISETEPETSTLSLSRTTTVMYIAIGAAAGGLIVVVLVIVVIICTCRNRSNKSNADETAGDYKKEIDIDDGEMNHITAAERYISIKSEQVSVKYTVENGKAASKTSEPGKSWGGGYEQVVLPNEEPDSGFLDQDSIVDHVTQTQPSPDIHETPNAIQYTEEEDDYAEVDSESVTEENIPEICIKSASIKKAETNDEQEAEDDYDHFGQPDQRQSVSSNYDHVHLRNSRKSKKGNNQDDSEDYDHIPGAGGRQEETEVDSTYDHTQIFGLRESTASVSSNYDHVVLLKNQCGQEDALNRISDDYDHTNNVSKVKVADGDRDSNYTQVILPDSP
ncbi:uncharacterized protein LOC110458433 isoform X2 [Mizuhopecten yessoensis]|uniref:uncharacterized protein LOC110458433 isoform X2 n=1 Tax=Mizuhopecten yessoensis TaxID=6573 RepID=UPI000B4599F2|nr:uncharacterized protein LOC110458433 isoform X2 [Mizuhopecten yessoensis]